MCRPTSLVAALLLLLAVPALATPQRTLTFGDRLAAEAALAATYAAHREGAPAGAPVPASALAHKAARGPALTAALEATWGVRIDAGMLAAELRRMEHESRLPERLAELFAALGNDAFVVQECLVRPVLAERLALARFTADRTAGRLAGTWDEWRDAALARFAGVDISANADGTVPLVRRAALAMPQALPADDLWENGRLGGAPVPRSGNSAVWTGTEWLVWGGESGGQALGSGGRFDPAIAAWSPINVVGAPLGRRGHTAVWTGSQMIVWGGTDLTDVLGNGAAYDPALDQWVDLPFDGAPAARTGHVAVWTGSAMILWGGWSGAFPLDDGAIYDPATVTWTPTPGGAPGPRVNHTAVWTGTEMIVWGGATTFEGTVKKYDGARLDPAAGAWRAMSIAGPEARDGHAAAWTGAKMVVWGGRNASGTPLATGKLYDPVSNTWTTMTTTNAPDARYGHSIVWTGTRAIVWGGAASQPMFSGASYDPVDNTWTALSTTGAPAERAGHVATFTTGVTPPVMLVWGGAVDGGGTYDPATDTWGPLGATDLPAARARHTAIYTGAEMIVFGGWSGAAVSGGAAYDPATDSWSSLASSGLASRANHAAVWTGTKMLVWGGDDGHTYFNNGSAYDPAANTWSALSGSGAPTARSRHAATWNGSRMIVWGGYDGHSYLGDGASIAPGGAWAPLATTGAPAARAGHTMVQLGANTIVFGGDNDSIPVAGGARWDGTAWTALPTGGAPGARTGHAACATPTKMIVWGGWDGSATLGDGAIYDPQANAWSAMSTSIAPFGRSQAAAVCTGAKFIVWGGHAGPGGAVLGDGGRYDVASDSWESMAGRAAPDGRFGHTAVWAPGAMIVWGGQSREGGDYSNSGGRYGTTATACSVVLSAPSASYAAAGGSGTVGVMALDGCAWSAGSNQAWVTLGLPTSGKGQGIVSFTVGAKSDTGDRSAALTIGGQAFAVQQAGVLLGPSAPADGLAIFADTAAPQFTWIPGSNTSFRVEWSNSSSFSKVVASSPSGKPGTSATPTAAQWKSILKLAPSGGTIYWRVVAFSGKTKTPVGSARTMVFSAAIAPSILAPADGATIAAAAPPTVRWTAGHAAKFQVTFTGSGKVASPLMTGATQWAVPAATWTKVVKLAAKSGGHVTLAITSTDALLRKATSASRTINITP